MKKVFIGLTMSYDTVNHGVYRHSNRVSLIYDYIEAVIKTGAVPVPITVSKDKNNLSFVDDLMDLLDGVILTGGNDINPNLYNMEPHPELGEITPERDNLELKVIESALKKNKGIFGICRGMQLLNVYFGGTLYQDLSENPNVKIKHKSTNTLDIPVHSIEVKDYSLVRSIVGEKHFVNSFHHQTIKDLAPDLKVSAYAADGIVEALEHKHIKNIFGVQFHPEMMVNTDTKMQNFFNKFVELCI